MVKIVNGNLLKAKEKIICQQVNCKGVMGAGLAKQIKDLYPEIVENYKVYCSTLHKAALGTILVHEVSDDRVIINLFGQNGYGREKRQTDYDALYFALKRACETAYNSYNQMVIAVPYGLGCGLAGGDWKEVYSLIVKASVKTNTDIIIYKF